MHDEARGSDHGCRRIRAATSSSHEYTSHNNEHTISSARAKALRREPRSPPLMYHCPACDLDNILRCDNFDGDQLFRVIPIRGQQLLYLCYRCERAGLTTCDELDKAQRLMALVLEMQEIEFGGGASA